MIAQQVCCKWWEPFIFLFLGHSSSGNSDIFPPAAITRFHWFHHISLLSLLRYEKKETEREEGSMSHWE